MSLRTAAPTVLIVAAAGSLAALGAGCGAVPDLPGRTLDRNTLVAELADIAPAARSIEARTSVPTRYTPCTISDDLSAPARCVGQSPPDAAALRVAARAAAVLRDSLSPDALRASALVDLQWGDTAGNSLGRSLQSLRQAARYERSSPAWADLAAAELVRADREHEPRARLSALDAAARAVSLDSANPVARFNLALAAERLGLDGRAREEWMRYLALEGDAGWRGEARTRIAAIDRRTVPSVADTVGVDALRILAARDPAALRSRTLARQLGAWSTASRNNQPTRADSALRLLRSAGDAIAAAHGDRTLLDVAAELSTGLPRAGVVEAAGAFAGAQDSAQRGRYAAAESLFARAAAGPAPTIAAWGRAYEAIQQVYTGKAAHAMAGLRVAMADARVHDRPALEARAGWTLAVMILRAGRRDEAGVILNRVAALSAAVGDSDTVAGVQELRGEDRYAAGDERSAWRLAIDAMSTLRGRRASLRLRSALNLMAWAADDRGLSGAAAVLRDEDAAVALAGGHPEFHAEALLAAARSRLLQGDTAAALRTLRDVERSAAALPASDVAGWLAARAGLLRAEAGLSVTAASLDTAVRYFGTRQNDILLVDALLTRAQVTSAASPARAERDLDRALALMKSRASQYRSSAERRALERRLHDIAARSALVYLAGHEDARALAAIERGRMNAAPGRQGSLIGPVIDYLLVGDTLVAWRIEQGRVTTTRDTVSARAIAVARGRLVGSAESGVMDRSASAWLYDVLLRRHAVVLRDDAPLVIVADDELAGIPFAALFDTSGAGAHVVERVSVRVVPRLDDAVPSAARAPVARPLFVSDPAFDGAAYPGLPRLAGARTEVDASRRFYLASRVLAGAEATTSAVTAAMPSADLLHFASHARFDPERPEQSRLVLAPNGDATAGLSARTISGMRLGGVRLAVLSSCESTRSGVADAPLTIGLAKAFHDAGVPAVVGALWKVDDDATAALMTAFHDHYSRTRDPAAALRAAQRTMSSDPDPARRDPASWGAFVLTGR